MGFSKAKCQQSHIKMATYGKAGNGKTFGALLAAEGLAKYTKKRIAYVDSEYGTSFYSQAIPERKVHPEAFDFDVIHTRSLTEVLAEVKDFNTKKYGVIVIDSMSHLWDAAINCYTGPLENGEIPKSAWTKIKKPYRELVSLLLAADVHVIMCGREADRYEKDVVVGRRMRGEPESDYEPHLLLRLERRQIDDTTTYLAHVEKDRTGVLTGMTIINPDYHQICEPILPYLGSTNGVTLTDDQVASKDAEAISKMDAAKAQISAVYVLEYENKFMLAKDKAELEAASKELTPEIKKQMLPSDVSKLRLTYDRKYAIIKIGQ